MSKAKRTTPNITPEPSFYDTIFNSDKGVMEVFKMEALKRTAIKAASITITAGVINLWKRVWVLPTQWRTRLRCSSSQAWDLGHTTSLWRNRAQQQQSKKRPYSPSGTEGEYKMAQLVGSAIVQSLAFAGGGEVYQRAKRILRTRDEKKR